MLPLLCMEPDGSSSRATCHEQQASQQAQADVDMSHSLVDAGHCAAAGPCLQQRLEKNKWRVGLLDVRGEKVHLHNLPLLPQAQQGNRGGDDGPVTQQMVSCDEGWCAFRQAADVGFLTAFASTCLRNLSLERHAPASWLTAK